MNKLRKAHKVSHKNVTLKQDIAHFSTKCLIFTLFTFILIQGCQNTKQQTIEYKFQPTYTLKDSLVPLWQNSSQQFMRMVSKTTNDKCLHCARQLAHSFASLNSGQIRETQSKLYHLNYQEMPPKELCSE